MLIYTVLFNLPFTVLYLYAIHVSRQRSLESAQPARLAKFTFMGLLAFQVLSVSLGILMSMRPMTNQTRMPIFYFVSGLHTVMFLLLLGCVFGWRKGRRGAEYRAPALLVLVAIVLKVAGILLPALILQAGSGQGLDMNLRVTAVGFVRTVLNFSVYLILLKAIFGWRGHAGTGMDFPGSSAPASAAPITGQAVTPARTTGMFPEQDFIPYISGVMFLGGLVLVPMIWGGFTGNAYADSLFPSLISCGIFAFSHDKRGNFLLGRFLMLSIYTLVMAFQSANRLGSGGGRPFFMAGGLLGYLVMFGCGWAGIVTGRFFRRSMPQKDGK